MSVLKIIKLYPHVFNTEDRDYTEEEAIKLISTCDSKGSYIQQSSFSIDDSYHAVCRLYKLGLRQPAVDLSLNLIKKAAWYQEYNVACQVAKFLENHYFNYEDFEKSEYYRNLCDQYNLMSVSEQDARRIYNRVFYNVQHGLETNLDVVSESLENIKKKLAVDSIIYHVYYFQCKYYLSEGIEQKEWIESAIDYFEGQYFRHEAHTNNFRFKYIQFYINCGEIDMAKSLLSKYLNEVSNGSKSWFLFIYSLTEIFAKEGSIQAAKNYYSKAVNHEVFNGLAESEKDEWNVLKEMIFYSDGVRVIVDDNEE